MHGLGVILRLAVRVYAPSRRVDIQVRMRMTRGERREELMAPEISDGTQGRFAFFTLSVIPPGYSAGRASFLRGSVVLVFARELDEAYGIAVYATTHSSNTHANIEFFKLP